MGKVLLTEVRTPSWVFLSPLFIAWTLFLLAFLLRKRFLRRCIFLVCLLCRRRFLHHTFRRSCRSSARSSLSHRFCSLLLASFFLGLTRYECTRTICLGGLPQPVEPVINALLFEEHV